LVKADSASNELIDEGTAAGGVWRDFSRDWLRWSILERTIAMSLVATIPISLTILHLGPSSLRHIPL
jgi:hypothetical protein